MKILDINEFLSKMNSGEVATSSTADIRNEHNQAKAKKSYFKNLKKKAGTLTKLLIPADVAIPFNPLTGKVDDMHNRYRKFRTEVSATSTLLSLKQAYNRKPSVKAELLIKSGVTVDNDIIDALDNNKELTEDMINRLNNAWDTSDVSKLSNEDKKIFKRYRVPRIHTERVVPVNSYVVTGKNFPIMYRVKGMIFDENGTMLEPKPKVVSYGDFSTSLQFQRYGAWEEKNPNETKRAKDDKRSEYLDEAIVKSWFPYNYMLVFAIPLSNSGALPDINTITPEYLINNAFILRLNTAIKLKLESYMTGNFARLDSSFDFFEMDMTCPAGFEGMELGKKTTFDNPLFAISDLSDEDREKFVENVRIALDNLGDGLEEAVRSSSGVKEMTPVVEDTIRTEIAKQFPYEEQKTLISESIQKMYSDVIADIYGDGAANDLELSASFDELAKETVSQDAINNALEEIRNSSQIGDFDVVDEDLGEEVSLED